MIDVFETKRFCGLREQLGKLNWAPEIDLAAMGKDGWELVSVTSVDHGSEGRTSELRFYFKRGLDA